MPEGQTNATPQADNPALSGWTGPLAGLIVAGAMVVAVLGATNSQMGGATALMAGLTLAGAALLGGGFLGFLFGIPRAIGGKGYVAAPQPADDAGDGAQPASQPQQPVSTATGRRYLENTNLEEISDWLTKIIIGLTLVEYERIRDAILAIGEAFGPVFLPVKLSAATGAPGVSAPVAQAVAVAGFMYFLILGFLYAYLWTRTRMEALLRRQSALTDIEIGKMIEVKRQREIDADSRALELADDMLTGHGSLNADSEAALKQAVAGASRLARRMVFNQAREVWTYNSGVRAAYKSAAERDQKQMLVDRTVPVFRALVAVAPENHRYLGYLGFAQVRSTAPDYAEAERALEKAIELRKSDGRGEAFYEYNLALVLMRQPHPQTGADAEARNHRIAALLDSAKVKVGVGEMKKEDGLADWAKRAKYALG